MSNLTRIEVNVKTGEIKEIELTAEEITALYSSSKDQPTIITES